MVGSSAREFAVDDRSLFGGQPLVLKGRSETQPIGTLERH